MTGRAVRRTRGLLLVVGLVLAGLTGCVSIPVSGPIEEVPGQPEACQSCVNVEVAPPAPGDDPRQVVEGYLRATSNYQPNYSVARQFLTTAAADSWRPEQGVSIYLGSVSVKGEKVTLDGQVVGALAEDRTYTAVDRPLSLDLAVVQENGEWRISRPPAGLMVTKFSFERFYSGYDLYFVANGSSLAPERIYLPGLRNPANLASALMTGLLAGPSQWLEPAVTTVLPQDTSLSVDSVTITNSVAEVQLSDAVLTLSDPQRSLMAAQIVYTLRQVAAIKGVLITVSQQKFRVPEADPTSLVVAVDAFSREIDPVPFVSDQLYAVNKAGQVQLVTNPTERAELTDLTGDVNRPAVDELAVSVNGTDLALVTDSRSTLRRAATVSGEVSVLARGLTDLLRPQFTRYGEVWAIGRQNGTQRLWRVADGRTAPVDAPVLNGAPITAFRVSPDGTRIALVRRTAGGSELGLARIVRGDRITVDAWRPVDLTQSELTQVRRIADVAWLDAGELLVLGATTKAAAAVPVRVAADASEITATGGEPANWDARQLTVLTRPQSVVVVGGDGRAWRYDGVSWLPLVGGLRTAAYAG